VLLIFPFSIVIFEFAAIDKMHLKIILYSVLIGTLFFSAYYLIYYFKELIDLSSFTRLGSKFDNQNSVARGFVLLAISFTYYSIKRKRIVLAIPIPVFVYLCLSTGSISNTFCCLLLIFLVLILTCKKKGRIITLIATILSIALIIVLLQMPFAYYFKTRIDNIFSTFFGTGNKIDESSVGRFDFAVEAFKLFFEKPLLGNGFNSVPLFTYGRGSYAHNNFAEILANFGFVFFALYEFVLLLPLLRKEFRKNNGCLFFFSLYIFIFQLFLVTYYLKIDGLILPLFAASIPSTGPVFSASYSPTKKRIIFDIKKTSAIVSKRDYYLIEI